MNDGSLTSRNAASGAPPAPRSYALAAAWIPRVVRCRRCQEVAEMSVHDRVSDAEISVRYVCVDCGWAQTRSFRESDL
jgi:lysyl-tRNA synthetase class I